MLNLLTLILSGNSFRSPGDSKYGDRAQERDRSASASSSIRDVEMDKDPSTIILALNTLADFEYSGMHLKIA